MSLTGVAQLMRVGQTLMQLISFISISLFLDMGFVINKANVAMYNSF